MKKLQNITLGVLALLLSSCASTVNFPVSNVAPAAVISAKMKQDKNKNNLIEINAVNLASADRLSPPKDNYVVWIVTNEDGTKSVGQLIIKNGKKSTLNTVTPFEVKEIFITAEEEGNLSYPTGTEISRINF